SLPHPFETVAGNVSSNSRGGRHSREISASQGGQNRRRLRPTPPLDAASCFRITWRARPFGRFTMTDHETRGDSPQPEMKKPVVVPVYNCHLYLASSQDGSVTARSSTLPEVVAAGRTEREALQNVVTAFKAAITRYQVRGKEIP